MAHIATSTHPDNTETAKADILDGIEDMVYRVEEFIDELGREIDWLTDENISEDVDDAAGDLGCQADDAAQEIRRAFIALRAALADRRRRRRRIASSEMQTAPRQGPLRFTGHGSGCSGQGRGSFKTLSPRRERRDLPGPAKR